MSSAYCGFVDAGYLRAQGSRARAIPGGQAQLQAGACVDWLQVIVPQQAAGFDSLSFLRAYWYDGALEPHHPGATEQRHVFDGIAFSAAPPRTPRGAPRQPASSARSNTHTARPRPTSTTQTRW